ncbi:MAG: PDZ domain-containing protein [Verrucomicrobia bacterium]|nr:PDZ domain-containing protein [Verrucomicrobiota bacterium]
MHSLHQIPLHMLMLAGLVGPLAAQDKPAPASPPTASPAAKAALVPQAYIGLYVNSLTEDLRGKAGVTMPDSVGVNVIIVDSKGPSAGKVEVGDILTRLDDQVLVTPEQFRALVRMRKPGDKLKLVAVRESSVKTIEVELTEKAVFERTAPTARSAGTAPAPDATNPLRITVNGQQIDLGSLPAGNGTVTQVGPGHVVIIGPNQGLPPEVLKQLEEMRARGLPIPPLDLQGFAPGVSLPDQVPNAQGGTTTQRSQTFSFSLGGPGAKSSSSSVASDDQGTVSLEQKDGKKHAVIKDADGKVTFDGDVTTEDQRAKLPAATRDRLKLVEGSFLSIQGQKPAKKADGAAEPEAPKKKRNPKEGA